MKTEYTTTDIGKMFGLTLTNIHKLMNNGYLIPSIALATGQGTPNLFSEDDLIYVLLFKRLFETGFRQKDAAKTAKFFFDEVKLHFQKQRNAKEFILIVRGKHPITTIVSKTDEVIKWIENEPVEIDKTGHKFVFKNSIFIIFNLNQMREDFKNMLNGSQ